MIRPMKYSIFIFLFFSTWGISSISDIDSRIGISDTILKLNTSLQIFIFTEENRVTGTITKIQFAGVQGDGKNIRTNKIKSAYILKIEGPIKVLNDGDIAEEVALVKEVQLIVPDHFVEYVESAVKKRRKVSVVGRFLEGQAGHHIKEIFVDVESVHIVK